MIATVVETKNLLETVAASLIAGIGVTAAFSIVVFGITRSADMNAVEERPLLATAAGSLAVLAGAVVVAAIVFGIVVMTAK